MNLPHTTSAGPYRKPPLLASEYPSLEFSYAGSADGIDQHLLILLHGLGDTHGNFMQFGKRMELPQTAVLAVGGPFRLVPDAAGSYRFDSSDVGGGSNSGGSVTGSSEDAWLVNGRTWVPSFHPDGREVDLSSLLGQTGLATTRTLLLGLVRLCVRRWGVDRVLVFGFAQGGVVAVDLILALAESDAVRVPVVSVCGWLPAPPHPSPSPPSTQQASVLIIHGENDVSISKEIQFKYEAYLRSRLPNKDSLKIARIPGKDHCLPGKDRNEMRHILAFFASHMILRNIQLESMADVYEVK
ncbi:hypothetical protein HK100_003546 [Physocladia obscura]|uniref:Phospholipase/carboxylesterase/thioesterase domain-containing protein n=1 Tax=Physocladia obscura TaxID=109957 RepID=A0AAD5TCB7_9FUNG|nr:hypothetical protein HK100_003546 [Physocladia obscura]